MQEAGGGPEGKLPGEGNQGLIFFYSASRKSNTWRQAVRKAHPGEKTKATARPPLWFVDFLGPPLQRQDYPGKTGEEKESLM